MRNKKGFTLIELIGVIIVIALLTLLITPIVSNVLSSSKEKLYKNTLKNIELSAKDWFTDEENIEKLPINVDECYISLADLKAAGVVDLDIKNPKDGSLLDDTLINVLVNKQGNGYEFTVVDDGSINGNQCTNVIVNVKAPIVTANTFTGFKRNYDLNVSYNNLNDANGNTFEYCLTNSSENVQGCTWNTYVNDTPQTIGTNLNGTYYVFVKRLFNIEDGEEQLSTLGGVLIKDGTQSYHRFGPYKFDNIKPRWVFQQKTNTNYLNETELQRLNYAYDDDTVTIKFRGLDDNYSSNSLTLDKIGIYIGGVDVTTSVTKLLNKTNSLANGVEYTLTLSNMTQKGELSISIAADTITDKAGNTNDATTIDTKIKVNLCAYPDGYVWDTSKFPAGKSTKYITLCDGLYNIELGGNKGGNSNGGNGARTKGDISLYRKNVLTVVVANGKTPNGGSGWSNGGGSTDVRIGGTNFESAIMIAAGGGGGTSDCPGAAGGDKSGNEASCGRDSWCSGESWIGDSNCEGQNNTCKWSYAKSATQGGAGGGGATQHCDTTGNNTWNSPGGNGKNGGSYGWGGGGGGGLYGGGAGPVSKVTKYGGGGGSSCVSSDGLGYSSKCRNNSYLFSNVNVTAGANSGNGYAKITLVTAY